MTDNPDRIRALLDDTLAGEPPLVDLVPAAVTGAERNQRRARVMAGGAAVAVLAVTIGAYGITAGHHGRTAVTPTNSTSSTNSSFTSPPVHFYPPAHKSDLGIPGLFDHPGTPQEQCANIHGPALSTPEKLSSARAWCARALTEVRGLLPDAVVVLDQAVDFGQMTWSAPLMQTADGKTLPGFVQAYQQAATQPAKVDYELDRFAFRTANGDGEVYYETTPPGTIARLEPNGDMPFGDGTSGFFKQSPDGTIGVSGVTATGMFYALDISGVHPVYGASGSTLHPDLKTDGLDHEVFPDGYVAALGTDYQRSIPTPYTAADIHAAIAKRGLGKLVNAIGANPVSLLPAP